VVLLDQTVDYLAMARQGAERRLLVLPHEAAVAEHVGAEYGGELALQTAPLRHGPVRRGWLSIRSVATVGRARNVIILLRQAGIVGGDALCQHHRMYRWKTCSED
jgi:hypothetical protein